MPLLIVIKLEGGILSTVRWKFSFISNISSSFIVTLIALWMLPATNVRLRDAMRKSFPPVYICIDVHNE